MCYVKSRRVEQTGKRDDHVLYIDIGEACYSDIQKLEKKKTICFWTIKNIISNNSTWPNPSSLTGECCHAHSTAAGDLHRGVYTITGDYVGQKEPA